MSDYEILPEDIEKIFRKLKAPIAELLSEGMPFPHIAIALSQMAVGIYCTQNPSSSWDEQLRLTFDQIVKDYKESGIREAAKEKKKDKE